MTRPVYLIDDDEAVRNALALLLDTVGIDVRAFASPEAFLSSLNKLKPGCLIVDIRMPVISGLKLQERLRDSGVAWPTVVISGHGDIEACRRAFRNGATDFLSKPIDEQDLIDAIQRAQSELDRLQRQASEVEESRRLLKRFTAREIEVLEMIARGLTSRQIADALSLSPRTVESHRAAIGTKAGTSSAAELTRLWLETRETP